MKKKKLSPSYISFSTSKEKEVLAILNTIGKYLVKETDKLMKQENTNWTYSYGKTKKN